MKEKLQLLASYVENSQQNDLQMYFITRQEKVGLKAKRKALEKYDYTPFRVDINDEIRQFLYNVVQQQVNKTIKDDWDITPYGVFTDDSEQVYTYSTVQKIQSFVKIIETLSHKAAIITMQNFTELLDSGMMWAYCIELAYKNENDELKYLYVFRKISSAQIVTEEQKKGIQVIFSTKSNKLEFLKGSTIKLDRQIDCAYMDDTFYILQKKQFETLVGLCEDFKEEAISTYNELQETDMFRGLELLSQVIEENTAIHKKLVQLKRLGNYSNITASMITKMKKAAKAEHYTMHIDKDGKIILNDKEDVKMIIKLLCDYYKQGVVTGKQYGTYAGKEFSKEESV